MAAIFWSFGALVFLLKHEGCTMVSSSRGWGGGGVSVQSWLCLVIGAHVAAAVADEVRSPACLRHETQARRQVFPADR